MDVITCATFRDCRLRGVGVVRGVSLPSPIDLTRHTYNTGHTVCDVEHHLLTRSILILKRSNIFSEHYFLCTVAVTVSGSYYIENHTLGVP